MELCEYFFIIWMISARSLYRINVGAKPTRGGLGGSVMSQLFLVDPLLRIPSLWCG